MIDACLGRLRKLEAAASIASLYNNADGESEEDDVFVRDDDDGHRAVVAQAEGRLNGSWVVVSNDAAGGSLA